MTISNRLIVGLAILSIAIAFLSLYLNEEQYNPVQRGATVQFEVGVTVRPNPNQSKKPASKTFRQRIQDTFRGFFRKFPIPNTEKNS